MVNIVVVSHSYSLAEEVINFSRAMTGNKELDYKILNAAGMENRVIGTSAEIIESKLKEALKDSSGVLVFHEIGSSILSAEVAISMFDEEEQSKIELAKLPLVEGLFLALNINNSTMSAKELKDLLKLEIESLYS